MTTNAADQVIIDYAEKHRGVYTAKGANLEEIQHDIERRVQQKLQMSFPFTDAFIGRVGGVVPFLPVANEVNLEEGKDPLLGEMMTARLNIQPTRTRRGSNSVCLTLEQTMRRTAAKIPGRRMMTCLVSSLHACYTCWTI